VQDAVHTTTFARANTSTGRLAEADTLYQAIAFQHRTLNRFQTLLNTAHSELGQEEAVGELLGRIATIWQDLFGSTELLATRYDILVGLQGDPQQQANASILEAYASAPAGNSALAKRAHAKFLAAEVKATTNNLARRKGAGGNRNRNKRDKRAGANKYDKKGN